MNKLDNSNIARPNWGLFDYVWVLHPKKFFHDVYLWRLRNKYFKKFGYSETAIWATDDWFIEVMRNIIKHYRFDRTATTIMVDNYDDSDEKTAENEQVVNNYYDKMLALLDEMDEKSYSQFDPDLFAKRNKAKDEFMEMFSKIFYHLWE